MVLRGGRGAPNTQAVVSVLVCVLVMGAGAVCPFAGQAKIFDLFSDEHKGASLPMRDAETHLERMAIKEAGCVIAKDSVNAVKNMIREEKMDSIYGKVYTFREEINKLKTKILECEIDLEGTADLMSKWLDIELYAQFHKVKNEKTYCVNPNNFRSDKYVLDIHLEVSRLNMIRRQFLVYSTDSAGEETESCTSQMGRAFDTLERSIENFLVHYANVCAYAKCVKQNRHKGQQANWVARLRKSMVDRDGMSGSSWDRKTGFVPRTPIPASLPAEAGPLREWDHYVERMMKKNQRCLARYMDQKVRKDTEGKSLERPLIKPTPTGRTPEEMCMQTGQELETISRAYNMAINHYRYIVTQGKEGEETLRVLNPVEKRRAYLLLGIMVHEWAWCPTACKYEGAKDPMVETKHIPKEIAVPWVTLGVILGRPLGLGSAELMEFNWKWSEGASSRDIEDIMAGHVEPAVGFALTETEKIFYRAWMVTNARAAKVVSVLSDLQEYVAEFYEESENTRNDLAVHDRLERWIGRMLEVSKDFIHYGDAMDIVLRGIGDPEDWFYEGRAWHPGFEMVLEGIDTNDNEAIAAISDSVKCLEANPAGASPSFNKLLYHNEKEFRVLNRQSRYCYYNPEGPNGFQVPVMLAIDSLIGLDHSSRNVQYGGCYYGSLSEGQDGTSKCASSISQGSKERTAHRDLMPPIPHRNMLDTFESGPDLREFIFVQLPKWINRLSTSKPDTIDELISLDYSDPNDDLASKLTDKYGMRKTTTHAIVLRTCKANEATKETRRMAVDAFEMVASICSNMIPQVKNTFKFHRVEMSSEVAERCKDGAPSARILTFTIQPGAADGATEKSMKSTQLRLDPASVTPSLVIENIMSTVFYFMATQPEGSDPVTTFFHQQHIQAVPMAMSDSTVVEPRNLSPTDVPLKPRATTPEVFLEMGDETDHDDDEELSAGEVYRSPYPGPREEAGGSPPLSDSPTNPQTVRLAAVAAAKVSEMDSELPDLDSQLPSLSALEDDVKQMKTIKEQLEELADGRFTRNAVIVITQHHCGGCKRLKPLFRYLGVVKIKTFFFDFNNLNDEDREWVRDNTMEFMDKVYGEPAQISVPLALLVSRHRKTALVSKVWMSRPYWSALGPLEQTMRQMISVLSLYTLHSQDQPMPLDEMARKAYYNLAQGMWGWRSVHHETAELFLHKVLKKYQISVATTGEAPQFMRTLSELKADTRIAPQKMIPFVEYRHYDLGRMKRMQEETKCYFRICGVLIAAHKIHNNTEPINHPIAFIKIRGKRDKDGGASSALTPLASVFSEDEPSSGYNDDEVDSLCASTREDAKEAGDLFFHFHSEADAESVWIRMMEYSVQEGKRASARNDFMAAFKAYDKDDIKYSGVRSNPICDHCMVFHAMYEQYSSSTQIDYSDGAMCSSCRGHIAGQQLWYNRHFKDVEASMRKPPVDKIPYRVKRDIVTMMYLIYNAMVDAPFNSMQGYGEITFGDDHRGMLRSQTHFDIFWKFLQVLVKYEGRVLSSLYNSGTKKGQIEFIFKSLHDRIVERFESQCSVEHKASVVVGRLVCPYTVHIDSPCYKCRFQAAQCAFQEWLDEIVAGDSLRDDDQKLRVPPFDPRRLEWVAKLSVAYENTGCSLARSAKPPGCGGWMLFHSLVFSLSAEDTVGMPSAYQEDAVIGRMLDDFTAVWRYFYLFYDCIACYQHATKVTLGRQARIEGSRSPEFPSQCLKGHNSKVSVENGAGPSIRTRMEAAQARCKSKVEVKDDDSGDLPVTALELVLNWQMSYLGHHMTMSTKNKDTPDEGCRCDRPSAMVTRECDNLYLNPYFEVFSTGGDVEEGKVGPHVSKCEARLVKNSAQVASNGGKRFVLEEKGFLNTRTKCAKNFNALSATEFCRSISHKNQKNKRFLRSGVNYFVSTFNDGTASKALNIICCQCTDECNERSQDSGLKMKWNRPDFIDLASVGGSLAQAFRPGRAGPTGHAPSSQIIRGLTSKLYDWERRRYDASEPAATRPEGTSGSQAEVRMAAPPPARKERLERIRGSSRSGGGKTKGPLQKFVTTVETVTKSITEALPKGLSFLEEEESTQSTGDPPIFTDKAPRHKLWSQRDSKRKRESRVKVRVLHRMEGDDVLHSMSDDDVRPSPMYLRPQHTCSFSYMCLHLGQFHVFPESFKSICAHQKAYYRVFNNNDEPCARSGKRKYSVYDLCVAFRATLKDAMDDFTLSQRYVFSQKNVTAADGSVITTLSSNFRSKYCNNIVISHYFYSHLENPRRTTMVQLLFKKAQNSWRRRFACTLVFKLMAAQCAQAKYKEMIDIYLHEISDVVTNVLRRSKLLEKEETREAALQWAVSASVGNLGRRSSDGRAGLSLAEAHLRRMAKTYGVQSIVGAGADEMSLKQRSQNLDQCVPLVDFDFTLKREKRQETVRKYLMLLVWAYHNTINYNNNVPLYPDDIRCFRRFSHRYYCRSELQCNCRMYPSDVLDLLMEQESYEEGMSDPKHDRKRN